MADVLVRRHRDVVELLDRLDDLSGSTSDEVSELARTVTDLLTAHWTVLREHAYPRLCELDDEGRDLAGEQQAEQTELDGILRQLTSLPPDDREFWPLAHIAMRQVRQRQHIERCDVLPRLRAASAAPRRSRRRRGARRTLAWP